MELIGCNRGGPASSEIAGGLSCTSMRLIIIIMRLRGHHPQHLYSLRTTPQDHYAGGTV